MLTINRLAMTPTKPFFTTYYITKSACWLLTALSLKLATQSVQAVNTYTIIALSTNNSRASAINDSNVVAGLLGDVNAWPLSTNIHVLRWRSTTGTEDLGTAGYSGWATAVNNSGVISGMGATKNYGDVAVFRCPLNASTLTLLSKLPGGGDANSGAINASGVVIGFGNRTNCCCGYWQCVQQPGHAVAWSNATVLTIPDLGGYCSDASGINDSGVVCGNAATPTNALIFHGFRNLSLTGVAQDLGTLGGSNSFAAWINNAGLIVGYAQLSGSTSQHAVLWNNGSIQDLGLLPGGTNSGANFISSTGDILGYSDNKTVLWPADSSPVDLNTLIPGNPGWTIISANGMNSSGIIAGSAKYQANAEVAVILVPRPLLTVLAASPDGVLAWPTNTRGFILQSTTNLDFPGWTTVFPPPTIIASQYIVTNSFSAPQTFYRLFMQP